MVGAGGQVRPGLAQLSFVGDAMFGIGELLSIIPAKCINWYIIVIFITKVIITVIVIMGCTQIPISTLSHIWVFVRLYGIMFVIIVIAIIIIMIIKSEGVNAQL